MLIGLIGLGAAVDTTVTLLLAGDVMLGRGIDQILRHSVAPAIFEPRAKSAREYVAAAERAHGPIPRGSAPEYVWGDALGFLTRFAPQVSIINLETAVTSRGEPWPNKPVQYRMHPANTEVLSAAGIDVAGLANNHVLDWGREGLVETLRTLQVAGIKTAGAGRDSLEAAAPAVIPVPDGRVLVYAVADRSSGVPASWAALPARPGVHHLPDLSGTTARDLARRIRSGSRWVGDRVVVSIHWGDNWGYRVPVEAERFAKTLIDEGAADVILGHSSHHPKGIEVYKGRLILYGAGDLLNDYEGIEGHQEFRPELVLMYLARLARSGKLESLVLVPLRIARFRLNRATAEEAAWLLARLRRQSRGMSFELTADGLIGGGRGRPSDE